MKRLRLRANERAGVIVTVRHRTTGEVRSVHTPGRRREALIEACSFIDLMGSDWRVVCYSTPQTIFHDLVRRHRPVTRPEAKALSAVGRLDLLDASIPRHAE